MKKDLIILLFLMILVVLTRTILHIAPNVEFITGASILGSYIMINKKISFLIPVLSLLISDLIIGNSNIYLFTWSAFLLAPVAGYLLNYFKKYFKDTSDSQYLLVGGIVSALSFTMIFFLWTNFGVVLLTNMYTKDLLGVIQSYINALPFLRNQIIGNIIVTPVLLVCYDLLIRSNTLTLFRINWHAKRYRA